MLYFTPRASIRLIRSWHRCQTTALFTQNHGTCGSQPVHYHTTSRSQRARNLSTSSEDYFDSNKSPSPKEEAISDQEWELRTGRTIFFIQETLPQFFRTGLVVAVDKESGRPAHPSYGDLSHSFNPLHSPDREYMYSHKVRLCYTPPIHLPSPFPETLQIEGLPLYLASSVFLRHTLNTLYSDLVVNLTKVVVDRPKSMKDLPSSSLANDTIETKKKPYERQKSLTIGLEVIGKARVSGTDGFWDILCTYTFSPETGLIDTHVVNSIHPSPSHAVYDSLRSSLARLVGIDPHPSGGRAFQKVPVPVDKRRRRDK